MINTDNKDKETDKIYVTRTEERDERDNMKKYKTFRTYSRKLAKCNKLHTVCPGSSYPNLYNELLYKLG